MISQSRHAQRPHVDLGRTDARRRSRVLIALLTTAAALLSLTIFAAPSSAAACTVTWTGGGGDGQWQTDANWSTGAAPTASDHACVPAPASVQSTAAGNQAASVDVDGRLTVSGGSLTLGDAAGTSAVGQLTLEGGTLSGAGELDVTDAFSWTSGTMAGSGSTVIEAAATGSIAGNPNFWVTLNAQTIVNRGTLTWSTGSVWASDAAAVENEGTFYANSEGSSGLRAFSGDTPTFTNTGTVTKSAGGGTSLIEFQFDNQGTVTADSGRLSLAGGGIPGRTATGTWSADGTGASIVFSSGSFALGSAQLSGAISVNATVAANDVQAANAHITVGGGSLSVSDPATDSHVGQLTVEGGSVTGAGALRVADAFTWTSGTQSGAGQTIVESTATGSIAPFGTTWVTLDRRTLVNRGETTWSSGSVWASNAATISNTGTFHANSEGNNSLRWASGDAPTFSNEGTVDKTAGVGTSVSELPFDNQSTVDAQTGQLTFSGGGVPGSTADGTWTTGASSRIRLSGGSFSAGTWDLTGTIFISANVTADDLQGDDADLTLDGGTLTLSGADGTAARRAATTSVESRLRRLNLDGGTLAGAGPVGVSNNFNWTAGTMSGAGETRIDEGATATISSGSWVTLRQRQLINQGELTWSTGSVWGMDGAGIDNQGTLHANSEGADGLRSVSGEESTLTNNGILDKGAGAGSTRIGFQIDNENSVIARAGRLNLEGGTIPGIAQGGEWCGEDGGKTRFVSGTYTWTTSVRLCGDIDITGGLTAPSVDGSDADIDMSGGTLNLTGTVTRSSARTLALSGGTVTGPGALDIADEFDWTGGSMSGTGQTTLAQGGTGTISTSPTLWLTLDQRLLINHGETTWSSGSIRGFNGAAITNTGTFHANSEASEGLRSFSGEPSVFRNTATGTVDKATGNGAATVNFQFDNQNAVSAQTGELRFSGGGIPYESGPLINDPVLCPTPRNAQQGSWSASAAANATISFASSPCVTLGTGTDLSGAVRVNGATVLAGAVQGPDALVYVDGGTLALEEPAAAAVLQSLYVGGTISGPGDVEVCGNLTWQAGAMTGTGAVEICPGGTGQVSPPVGPVALDRVLVNSGDLTWSSGTLTMEPGSLLVNDGTLRANAESSPGLTTEGGALIDNRGLLRKDAGQGSTAINVHVDNPGTIDRVTGTLIVDSTSCQQGSNTGEEEDPAGAGEPQPEPSAYPTFFDDPEESPGEGWEWRGKAPEGGDKGSWYNPETEESWHPDLNHGGDIGPHWDYSKKGSDDAWRWGPDRIFRLKKSACS